MEGALPLGPSTDALRGGLGRALPESRHSVPSGRPTSGGSCPTCGPRPLRRPPATACHACSSDAELLRHLASQRLVLVVLEDLHWADAMSLNLLSFVARRISGWPVMVVATA